MHMHIHAHAHAHHEHAHAHAHADTPADTPAHAHAHAQVTRPSPPALAPSSPIHVRSLAEEVIKLLAQGETNAFCIKHLRFILAGGAQLNQPVLAPQLARYNIALWPHYGQTELAGPALVGGLPGNLHAMRVVPDARWLLVNDDGSEADDEGELVLLGMHCATRGYLGDVAASQRLTGGFALPTSERFHTGDVFRRLQKNTKGVTEWLTHVCRRDDLLVHSTGEMTNPLPIEEALLGKCSQYVARLCVLGRQRTHPFVVLEPRDELGFALSAARDRVARSIDELNATLPGYSRIPQRGVLWLAPEELPLATSMKGNVIRGQAETRFANRMDTAAFTEQQDTLSGEDSISLTAKPRHLAASAEASQVLAARGHMMFVMMFEVCR